MIEVHDSLAPKRSVVSILLPVLFVFLCFLLTSGLWLGWTLLERAKCGTGDYTLRDEFRIKTFAWGVFNAPDWNESYSTQAYHIMRTWLSDTYNAVVFVDYLIYNCGHTQTDMDTYYSDESFRTQILANYQQVERVSSCTEGDTTLYVYNARMAESEYLTHTWVVPDGKYRVLEVFIAFPLHKQDVMAEYARRLFPNLPACP